MSRVAIPASLHGTPFGPAEAKSAGVGRGRLRGPDIGHPHHGVYTHGVDLSDLRERCAALAPRLGEREWFSHATAARLWGMPLPRFETPDEDVHVTSIEADDRIRRPGVRGWRVLEQPPKAMLAGGLALIAPADVWAQLSIRGAVLDHTMLSVEWLTAIGDFLISGARTDRGRDRPLCTIADLRAAANRHRGKRGAKNLSLAYPRIRGPVDSVKETFLRLGLIDCGLPEPEVQFEVRTAKGPRHADLGYRDARLLLEFQGDHHRTSRRQWLEDLTRVQLFQDAGYRVVLIGDADLTPDCHALAARIRRALSQPRA